MYTMKLEQREKECKKHTQTHSTFIVLLRKIHDVCVCVCVAHIHARDVNGLDSTQLTFKIYANNNLNFISYISIDTRCLYTYDVRI